MRSRRHAFDCLHRRRWIPHHFRPARWAWIATGQRGPSDRLHLRRSAAGEHGHVRHVGADDGDGLHPRAERQKPHCCFFSSTAPLSSTCWAMAASAAAAEWAGCRRIIEKPHLEHGAQNAMRHVCPAATAVPARSGSPSPATQNIPGRAAPDPGPALAALTRCCCVASPVRHDKAGKAPVRFQNIRQQVRVLAVVRAAGQVVGAHHRLHVRVFHADFERQQVALPPAPLVDDRVRPWCVPSPGPL